VSSFSTKAGELLAKIGTELKEVALIFGSAAMAAILWLIAVAASIAIGGIIVSVNDATVKTLKDGVEHWFQTGGAAGSAIGLLAGALVELVVNSKKAPPVAACLAAIATGVLFYFAFKHGPVLQGKATLQESQDASAILLLLAVVIGGSIELIKR
jgi:hypothetical protein